MGPGWIGLRPCYLPPLFVTTCTMNPNRSYDTGGMENPSRNWLQHRVRVTTHPQWGVGRVMRWFPAGDGNPARLRVMMTKAEMPQIVRVSDVEIID